MSKKLIINKTTLFFVLIALVVGLIAVAFFHKIYTYRLAELDKSYIEETQVAYKASFLTYERVTRIIFNNLINTNEILSLQAKAWHHPEHRDNIRKELPERLGTAYADLRAIGLNQLHFHFPDGTSFIRFHTPEKYGDPLFDVRPSLLIANKEKRYVAGFEEGRMYNGFRYVYPLFFDQEHIGSVETSISANGIMDEMSTLYSGHYLLYLRKSVVDSTVFKDEAAKNYQKTELSPDYLIEKSQKINQCVPQVNAMIASRIAKRLANTTPFVENVTFDGRDKVIIFLPIKSVTGDHVAWLACYKDDATRTNLNKEKWIVSGIVLLLILFIALYAALVYTSYTRLKDELAFEQYQKEEQQKLLIQQSKMAMMGEMIGSIAHQWRQPLNSLALIVQDLPEAQKYGELTEEYLQQSIDKSMETIHYMSQTIEDFRNFFRPDKEMRRVLLSSLIKEAHAMVATQLRNNNIDFILDEKEPVEVDVMPNEIKQVFLNLFTNAKDAIVAQGYGEGEIRVEVSANQEYALVTCSDSGGGIPDNIIDQLFQPYVTTKGENGTGIGLYMSRMIIENHNGTLTARNGEYGAIFTITLPRASQQSENLSIES